jgi:protein-disulfide isomerase
MLEGEMIHRNAMRRPALLALTLAAFSLSTPSMMAQSLNEKERADFRAEVRAYLLENPEVIMEAMAVLQARQNEGEAAQDLALVQANRDALFNDAGSWVGGNPDGDITIVEFTDYRCGYCRKAFSEIEELIKSDGNIRFIVKEFPILGEASVISAQFALAVFNLHGPDAYKGAHDGLIALRGEPDVQTLSKLATDLGYDPAPILAAMGGPEVAAQINANYGLGEAMQINGTPTFVVGDQLLRGYLPLEDMRAVVAQERG